MTKITYTKKFLEEEVSSFHLREACQGYPEALLRAFDWAETPQGNRYWSDQWNNLSPLDTEELQNMLDQYYYTVGRESADLGVIYDFDEMEVDRRYMDPFLEGEFYKLYGAFDWSATPQGGDFWRDVLGKSFIDSGVLGELKSQYWSWLLLNSDVPEAKVEEAVMTYDPVDKPAHYNMGGIECIDYIRQILGLDGFIAYCHGNMIKYQHRYRYKQNPREDMKKAQWYLNKMNEALEEKHQ